VSDGRASARNDPNSLSNRMRSRRFAVFQELAAGMDRRPLRIIDLGGTVRFWELRGWAGRADAHITLVNLAAQESRHANLDPVRGDVTDMGQFADGAFDIAFSNSVIEHLYTFEAQRAMAAHARRVADAYWVQTPNFWFPIEPHFRFLGWQWLPVPWRVALLRRGRFGSRGPLPDRRAAERAVREIRLMTRGEVAECFPGATIWGETFLGLRKSWVAYAGFPERVEQPVDEDRPSAASSAGSGGG
jgi:Methyltransferase domain